MTQFYVKKMVCVSTVVEADNEEEAEAIANRIPVEVSGWEFEWDDEEPEVEEAAD